MMAISTQTAALLELYNQKINLDNQQLTQVNYVQSGYTIQTGIGSTEKIKVWGPQEIIENYTPPIQRLDNRILELNNQILTLQNEILVVGQSANTCGCGGSVGFSTLGVPFFVGINTVTVPGDNLNYRGYTFTAPNPFAAVGPSSITSGNVGIGTEDIIIQSSLGVYYGNVGVARTTLPVPSCPTVTSCAGYATSITNLTSQISTLQTQRNDLMVKVNYLKSARASYELQNYSYNQSKIQINNSIGISSSIISFLQDPANSEWL